MRSSLKFIFKYIRLDLYSPLTRNKTKIMFPYKSQIKVQFGLWQSIKTAKTTFSFMLFSLIDLLWTLFLEKPDSN